MLKKAINSDLKELSIKTKDFCDNEHSYEVTGKLWESVCNNAMGI